jgi:hypothetical protein
MTTPVIGLGNIGSQLLAVRHFFTPICRRVGGEARIRTEYADQCLILPLAGLPI